MRDKGLLSGISAAPACKYDPTSNSKHMPLRDQRRPADSDNSGTAVWGSNAWLVTVCHATGMCKPDRTVVSTALQHDTLRRGSALQARSQSPSFAMQWASCLRSLEDEGLDLAPATLLCLQLSRHVQVDANSCHGPDPAGRWGPHLQRIQKQYMAATWCRGPLVQYALATGQGTCHHMHGSLM